MTDHLDFDTLNDLAVGELAASERSSADRHLAGCAECAGRLLTLRELLGRTRALPRNIEPPNELWIDVRGAIERRKREQLREAVGRRPAWWRRRSSWGLAAAALVLVASSSAVTALLLRDRAREDHRAASAQALGGGRPAPLPATLALVEAGYDDTARELEAALDLQRQRLSPKTIMTVERSLAVIDDAIAEARRALLEDPSNRALVDIFAANYERKLELLRRATELTSSL